jgi:transcriptional regulator with XRE-family HTH domain
VKNGLPPETFGEAVLRMRRREKLAAADLAERLGYKDRKTVERWEAGESVPAESAFPELAAELGVPAETLMRLAGIKPGPLKSDPRLTKLADQAADMERRLRALATSPAVARPKAPVPVPAAAGSTGRPPRPKPKGKRTQGVRRTGTTGPKPPDRD